MFSYQTVFRFCVHAFHLRVFLQSNGGFSTFSRQKLIVVNRFNFKKEEFLRTELISCTTLCLQSLFDDSTIIHHLRGDFSAFTGRSAPPLTKQTANGLVCDRDRFEYRQRINGLSTIITNSLFTI